MSALANRPFVKMNGLGNEILVIDLRDSGARVSGEDARALAGAGGLAFDQIMALHRSRTGADAMMRIINADGSEVSACGNGTRCVAWYLMRELNKDQLLLETDAGPLVAMRGVDDLQFTVDMGVPRFRWDQIPLSEEFADTRAIELQIGPIDHPVLHSPSVVNVGNPHAVFWVEHTEAYDLARLGPLLENHPMFPERANISLAEVTAPNALTLRVWERGAGLTKACGTAACAAGVCAARTGRTGRAVTVSLPGGELHIDWRESDDHMLMTGAVELEFEGRLEPALFEVQ